MAMEPKIAEVPVMRMPSEMKGPDKHNPCLGCLNSYDGWCGKYKKWGYEVKDRCIKPESVKVPVNKSKEPAVKTGIKAKPIRCIETNEIYESSGAAARAVGCAQSSISNCATGCQKTAKGYHWEYVEVTG